MLLPNIFLTDDVNGSATTASTSSTSTTTSITSETHILLDSLPPFDSNLNTFNDDANTDDSPDQHQSNIKCQTQKMGNELMTTTSTTTLANIAKTTIDCVKRFPVFDEADEAQQRTFHFPTKKCKTKLVGCLEKQNRSNAKKALKINVAQINEIKTHGHLELLAAVEDDVVAAPEIKRTKFPISDFNVCSTKACKEFPVSKQFENFRTKIFVKNNFLGFQILPFFNDLNMPQATAAAVALAVPTTESATYTSTTATISTMPQLSTKIITHATNIAAAATTALILEQMEHSERRQEAQVHAQNDQEQRANSNNDSAAANFHIDDGINSDGCLSKSARPTGETITMEKQTKLDNSSSGVGGKQFMNVCAGGCTIERFCGQTDTHNIANKQAKEQTVDINELKVPPLAPTPPPMPPLIYDDNDAFEHMNFEPKLSADGSQRPPPQFAHQQNYSDVRDTSSKEVLVNKAAASCSGQSGTFEQPTKAITEIDTATIKPTAPRQPTKSTFSLFDVLTSHAGGCATPPTPPATAVPFASSSSIYDKLPNLELLPHFYTLELVDSNVPNWTETTAATAQLNKWAVDLDNKKKNSIKKFENLLNASDVKRQQQRGLNAQQQNPIEERHHSKHHNCGDSNQSTLRRAYSEMTLTKLEEHDEGVTPLSSSEPPSPVLSLSGEQLLSNTTNATFDEMKFEMRTTKVAQTPSKQLHDNLKHERLRGNLPGITPATTTQLRPQTNAKNLPTHSLARSQSSTLSALPENARKSGEKVSATRLTTRPTFETATRHDVNEVSRSASVDTLALLPARTQLRRQRRMASQSSVDKDEDPVERLNRLRARISGALSEVKGVLNKYSTETEPANEPTTTAVFPKPYEATSRDLPKTNSSAAVATTTAPSQQPLPTTVGSALRDRPSTTSSQELSTHGTSVEQIAPTAAAPATQTETADTNDGPVQFRFVRKVRRRSVFLEEDEQTEQQSQANEQQAQVEEQQVPQLTAAKPEESKAEEKLPLTEKPKEEQQMQRQAEMDKGLKSLAPEQEALEKLPKLKEAQGQKEQDSIEFKKSEEKADQKEKVDLESSKLDEALKKVDESQAEAVQMIKTEAAEQKPEKLEKTKEQLQPKKCTPIKKEGSPKKTLESTSKINAKNLPKIEINKPESLLKAQQSIEEPKVRMRKKPIGRLEVDIKENLRRASTGAIKETAAGGVLELQNAKNERRPSDSATLMKGNKIQPAKAEEKRKLYKSAKKSTSNDEKVYQKSVDLAEKPKETAPQSTAKPQNAKQTETGATPKKRLAVKRVDSLRRASIAAVEKSKIEPPLKEQTALEVKAQRRASDASAIATTSAAAVEKPTTPMTPTTAKSKLITRRPTPRVKAGAKVKRASVILNETAETTLDAVDESTAASAATALNKDAKAGKSIDATSIKVIDDVPATFLSSTQSSLSTTLLTPALIDSATTATASSIAAAAAVDAVDTIKDSLKNATKTIGQSVALATAVPTSLAHSNEASSRLAHANDTSSLLAVDKIAATKKGTTTAVPCSDANALINQKLATNEKSSTEIAKIEADIKKPIHQQQQQQQEKIPAAPIATQLTQQQVADSGVLAALDSVPEIESKAIGAPSACEVKCSSESATSIAVGIDAAATVSPQLDSEAAATKTAYLAVESNSGAQTSASNTHNIQKPTTVEQDKLNQKMPELQILPAPVKAVQIPADNRKYAPLNLPREEPPKKKLIFKKIVRQKSTEKPTPIGKKPTKDSKDASSQTAAPATVKSDESVLTKIETEPAASDAVTTVDAAEKAAQENVTEEVTTESPVSEEPPPAPKKPRKVKKKVIIRRQQRRLSISDQTFYNSDINSEEQADNAKTITETLEKAIAYVTDDDDEYEDEAPKVELPLKGCMRPREFQVGESVLYAERYKRTQVRWKKGRVLERITSISYKLDIDGKEVPAHISYIKRYTDRKVSFAGKEYLEIDYEQIAEETQKARSYSIWNMV